MREADRNNWCSQGVSLLLHVMVLIWGGHWLVRHAEFGVDTGKGGGIPGEYYAAVTLEDGAEPERLPVEPEAAVENRLEDRENVITAIRKPAVSSESLSSEERQRTELKINPSSPGAGGTRVSVKPHYLKNPPPSYPSSAKRRGEEGMVVLQVDVNSSGNVERISVRRTSGVPLLDQAALEAVRRWRFRPATVGGAKVSSRVTVPVAFCLD